MKRYSGAAFKPEAALCCPVQYDTRYLKAIPAEVIEKDYGCGDPSRYLHPGETVLDLGSGTGKICFIAAQVLGPTGRVIGVDMTDDMLAVARRNAPIVAKTLGYANVEFRKGRIQDLALDLEQLESVLKSIPATHDSIQPVAEEIASGLRERSPMIPDNSVDVVVSNCVLNLVDATAKATLFRELFRVIRPGGRAVISDIVSDQVVPESLRNDPILWSGCISGAFTEEGFLEAFLKAGFHGLRIAQRDTKPRQTVEGIEFRSVTIEAFKEAVTATSGQYRTVMYQGPFAEVIDDHGNRLSRGIRTQVSEQSFRLLLQSPYASNILSANAEAGEINAPASCCDDSKCC